MPAGRVLKSTDSETVLGAAAESRKQWATLVAKRCHKTDRLTAEASWGSETIAAMLIGYARISTGKQDLTLQLDALERAGCERTFQDTASGALKSRPELEACLDHLRAGDTLVVWRLDRLGRSLRHLIETVSELEQRAAGFRSLTEGVDTTTAAGRMIFHIFGALAEFERSLIQERTLVGLEAARARGRHGGRPSSITPDKLAAAAAMRQQNRPMHAIATALGVSRATLYRHLGDVVAPA